MTEATDQDDNNVDREAALYGQIWSVLNRTEAETVRIARKYMGDDDFTHSSAPFLESSLKTHTAVDALKAKFLQSFDAPVAEREAFIAQYVKEMPEHLEAIYHGTLSLARALRDHIPEGQRLQKDAVKIVDNLEKMQPERAAEYHLMEKSARAQAESEQPSNGRKR
jgi:hypothetical protein